MGSTNGAQFASSSSSAREEKYISTKMIWVAMPAVVVVEWVAVGAQLFLPTQHTSDAQPVA